MRPLLNPKYLLVLALGLLLCSCATLPPYERIYQNDPEMQMNVSSTQQFEQYMQSIREGAFTAEGLKGSGGCGCN